MVAWLSRFVTRRFGGREQSRQVTRSPALLDEAAEEAIGVPLRSIRRVRDALAEFQQDAVELRGGGFVDGLIQIVGGRVVAVLQPILRDLLLGRFVLVAEFERERGHTLANETVLIA